MSSTVRVTDDSPSIGNGRQYRIAVTAGRIAVPPSYFLVDLIGELQGAFDVRVDAQRVDVPAEVADTMNIPRNGRRSPFRVMAGLMGYRPDVIHQHWATWSTPAVAASVASRAPLVVSVHGYDAFLPRAPRRLDLAVRLLKRAERRLALRQATTVVVNSDYMRRRVETLRVPGARIRVVRHGVDTDSFTPALGARRGVLFVGRLSPEKGCDLAIRALSTLPVDSYESLRVVGDGPELDSLRSLAADRGVPCHFLGQQPRARVIREMQGARLLVVPSLPARGQVEGSGLVPLEGQACGTPTVVTDVGGLPENIPPQLGFLVCKADPASVATAIGRALALPDATAVIVREHVLAHHSVDAVRRSYADLYSDLLARR